jgi:hypothetical protein
MFLRYAVALVATYLVTWTLSYVFMFVSRGDGLDFSHFFEYLVLAWTFRAGEVPSFIWLFSVAAFLPLALLVTFLLRRQARGAHALGGISGDGSRHI